MASIHFYRYFLKNNGVVTDFHVEDLVDHIWNNCISRQRTLKMDEHWYSMSAYWRPNDNMDLPYFWIDKSMSDNPWTGNLGTVNRERVSGTLYQPASCLLVPNSHTLIVYQPAGSPSQTQISNYLSSYIQATDDNDKLEMITKTVTTDLTFNQITNAFEIKELQLIVDPETFVVEEVFPAFDQLNSGARGILSGIQAAADAIKESSTSGEVPLFSSKIRKKSRKDPLNFIFIAFLQEAINNNNHGVVSASVTVRAPAADHDETIKLSQNSNLLQPFPANSDITGHDAIFNILNELYNDHHFPGLALDITQLPRLTEIHDEDTEFIIEPDAALSQVEMDLSQAERERLEDEEEQV
jgi:hypothetical protein